MPASWKTSLQVLLWFLVSLLLLGGSAWGAAWLASCIRGGTPDQADNLTAGLICGLAIWLFVAVFHLGKESIVVSVASRSDFFDSLKAILTDMGYRVISQQDDYLGTKPGFGAMLLGGGIHVHVEGPIAKVTGPKVCLEMVQTRLRYRNHLEKVQRRTTSPRSQEPETFLRHVEISATLVADDWDEFRKHVLQPLAAEGEVRLDVQLLVAPEHGVRNSIVEATRRWLDKHAEEAEVRKDFVQRFDPMLAETQPVP